MDIQLLTSLLIPCTFALYSLGNVLRRVDQGAILMLNNVNRVSRCNYTFVPTLTIGMSLYMLPPVDSQSKKNNKGSSSDDGPSTSADTSSDSSALFSSPSYADGWSSPSST